jgi:hypothetical protein
VIDSCALCGQEILDLSRSQVAKQVTGWAMPRRKGGQNTVALRYETGALAHVACVTAAKGKHAQEQLWDQSQIQI